MDTLYTFWDSITHYRTKSVHFLRLMNSATTSITLLSKSQKSLSSRQTESPLAELRAVLRLMWGFAGFRV